MKWSLSLGRIAGIKVFIHWTFLILVAWIVVQNTIRGQAVNQILWTLAFLFVLFFCVFLHEMGHALTARRYHIKTRDIIMLPIGGLARFENLPDDPKQELLVALAGPAVNLLIAAVLLLLINTARLNPENMELANIDQSNFILLLFSANLILAIFNLIPAFPMDGGRVLRALLAFKLNRVKATMIAAGIGQVLAIAFVFIGLFYNPVLLLIGVFIFLGAQSEASFAQTRDLLQGFRVADVTMAEYKSLQVDDPLSKAIAMLLDGQTTKFLVEDNGAIVGTLSRNEMVKALSSEGQQVSIGDVMNTDLVYFDADMELKDAFMKMHQHKHGLIPVKHRGEFIGVVDLENMQEFIMLRSARPEGTDPESLRRKSDQPEQEASSY
ncbi:MAG: site-2 protease family protein [Cyclobacteriaceae bacterium]